MNNCAEQMHDSHPSGRIRPLGELEVGWTVGCSGPDRSKSGRLQYSHSFTFRQSETHTRPADEIGHGRTGAPGATVLELGPVMAPATDQRALLHWRRNLAHRVLGQPGLPSIFTSQTDCDDRNSNCSMAVPLEYSRWQKSDLVSGFRPAGSSYRKSLVPRIGPRSQGRAPLPAVSGPVREARARDAPSPARPRRRCQV